MIHVNLSNSLWELLKLLHNDIKNSRKSFFDTFNILVSSVNYKRTIQEYFLKTENICMNLKFSFLEYFLAETFLKILGLEEKDVIILTLERNKIILTSLIFSILNDEEFQKNYQDIFKTILKDNFSEDYKTNFLWNLAEKLTDLFREYEYHRWDEIISNWKNSEGAYKLKPQRIELLQKDIYSKIFFDESFFKSDSKKYFSLPGLFEKVLEGKTDLRFNELKNPKKIYLFGFTQISKLHLKMLLFLKDYIDFEIFMPAYLGTVMAKNKLFKNFPYKLVVEKGNEILLPEGRNFDIIDDFLSPVTGTLFLLKETLKPKEVTIKRCKNKNHSSHNILSGVKDLFMNRTTNQKLKQDESLNIFSASSRWHEIESIYNSILYNIQHNKKLKFDDILIIVPDVKEYRNIIKDVFNRNPYLLHPEINSRKSIPFHIYEKNIFKESLFNSALSRFFNILENNFSKFDFINFIENPLIMKKFKIDVEDLSYFRKWLEKLNAFDEDQTFKFSTFSSLLKKLKLGFIMEKSTELNYQEIIPYSDSSTDVKRLNSFIEITEKLLAYKEKSNKKNTLTEWITFIKEFITDFILTELNGELSEEFTIFINFMRNLELLKEIETLLKNKSYSLNEAKLHFLNIMADILERNISSLFNGVTVSSFLPMRSIPFKIIYIAGMNEKEFPSEPDRSSLNLRNLKIFYNDIDRRHMDNFLFLEAIFSAEEKVYISYVGMNLEEDTELYPSSTVLAFINVMNEFLLEEEFKILKLPKSSFSEKYNNYGMENDILSNIFYTPHRIISYLKAGVKLQTEEKDDVNKKGKIKTTLDKINIKSLTAFILNPIEEMIKRKIGIFDTELETKASRALELNSRERTKLLNNAISSFTREWLCNKNPSFEEIFNKLYEYYYYNGDITEVEILNRIEKEKVSFEKIEKNLSEIISNCGNQFYDSIYFGKGQETNYENRKYYEYSISDVLIEGVIEEVFLTDKTLTWIRGKNKIDKNKLILDYHTLFFRLFISFLNLADKKIEKGKIIFIDLEGEIEKIEITPLGKETIEKIISYYKEEENFDLLPLQIIKETENKTNIIEVIEERLKDEYSYFDLSTVVKARRDYKRLLPSEKKLDEKMEILKKVILSQNLS